MRGLLLLLFFQLQLPNGQLLSQLVNRRLLGVGCQQIALVDDAPLTLGQPLDLEEALAVLAAETVYVPFEQVRDADGREAGIRVPGATGPDGRSYAVAGTAPAQLWAWSPTVGTQPTTLATIARVALDNGDAGIVVNPAGPPVLIPGDRLAALAAG